ncbi:hypothetical protein [Lentzea terrae]|uniref:hypothetical protein n=1 Tax=Lentzea terrae TaxID=2200761 RepID=UPI0013008B8E|nr:hypothetical protein [Lentzea terrae]
MPTIESVFAADSAFAGTATKIDATSVRPEKTPSIDLRANIIVPPKELIFPSGETRQPAQHSSQLILAQQPPTGARKIFRVA